MICAWPPSSPINCSSWTGKRPPWCWETRTRSSVIPPSGTSTATTTAPDTPPQDIPLNPPHVEAPTWAQFWDAYELFQDPILCALIAGGVLGFLGVYVVLRRMVFVSAAVTQSAGLGVALAFFAEIHLGVHVDPTAGAVGLALVATLVLMLDPSRLRLPRGGGRGHPRGGPHLPGGPRHPGHPLRHGGAGGAAPTARRGLGGRAHPLHPPVVVPRPHLRELRSHRSARAGASRARARRSVDDLHRVDGGRVGAGARRAAGVRLLHPVGHRRADAGLAATVDLLLVHTRGGGVGPGRLSARLLL